MLDIWYCHYFSLHLFWYSHASEAAKSDPDMHCISERIIAFNLGLAKNQDLESVIHPTFCVQNLISIQINATLYRRNCSTFMIKHIIGSPD